MDQTGFKNGMDWGKIIKEKVKCCACEGSLSEAKYMNIVTLALIAKWVMPTMGNVYFPNDPLQAIAILCDRCLAAGPSGKPSIKYAIEWTKYAGSVTYHSIEDLDPLPAKVIEKYHLLTDLAGKNFMNKRILTAFCIQNPKRN